MPFRLIVTLLCVLALTGCVSREQADARLARGCAAAIELFLPEGTEIKEIKNRIFGESDLGKGFRYVTLVLVESDGWYEPEKEYRCIFEEQMGIGNISHAAMIHQVRMDDRVYGKDGDKILGSFNDHLKLTETVDRALNMAP